MNDKLSVVGFCSQDSYLQRLEQSLRAFLLKLNICDSTLQPLPENSSWAVQVHTDDNTLLEMDERQIMVRANYFFSKFKFSRKNEIRVQKIRRSACFVQICYFHRWIPDEICKVVYYSNVENENITIL